jgi:hypothetical protein
VSTRWHTGRLLRIVAAPLLLGGVLTGLGSTAASALTCQGWTGGQPANPNDTGSGDSLNGVDMINSCNVWVVGGTGTGTTLIEHWTGGSTWTVVPSPNPGARNGLTSVSGISPTDIWAVGTASNADGTMEKSLIVHFDGTSWAQVPSPSPGTFNQLTSVHEISSTDAWAVGSVTDGNGFQTLTLHWDGTSWTQVASPSPGGQFNTFLTGVTATSGGDVWAVGDYISSQDPSVTLLSLILHWDGTSWKQVDSPSPGPVGLTQLTSVAATSLTNAWAVGFFPDGTANRNLILHWDGTSWSQVPSPNPLEDNRLDGVTATSADSAVAVGTGQAAPKHALTQAVTLRWDGTSWTPVPSLQKSTEITMTGVSSVSATETWAVGFFDPTPTKTLAFHLK